MSRKLKFACLAGAAMLLAAPAYAQKVNPDSNDPNNIGPPSGAILDLAGHTINFNSYTQYTTTFTATASSTTVTFLFRNDPGFTAFDDASVVDTTHASSNLLTNSGFESNLTGWTFLNIYGAGFAGMVATNSGGGGSNCGSTNLTAHSGSNFWCDGATQAYDALDQVLATTAGDSYTVSFWTTQHNNTGGGPNTVYQDISTNGHNTDTDTLGNGDDVLVYASANGPPPPVPEPSTWLMMLLGFGGLGFAGYRGARMKTCVTA
jgi:hypothetical protein